MQHIDEAMLHEYLDRSGETDTALDAVETHLASCGACRAKLDEAIALRAAAGDILRAASPVTRVMPPFAEIAARSGADSSARVAPLMVKKRSRTRDLAWAATVVLALGAGWIAKSMYGSDVAVEVAATPKQNAADAAVPPATQPAVAETAPAEAAGNAAPPSASQDVRTRLEAVSPPMVASAPLPVAPPVTAPAAFAQTSIRGSREDANAKASDLGTLVVTGDRNPLVPRDQVSRRSIVTGEIAAASADDSYAVRQLLRDADWQSVSADSAARAAGGVIVRARGLRVLDYAVAAEVVGKRVRVRQITQQGDTVMTVQLSRAPMAVIGYAPSGGTTATNQLAEGRRLPLYGTLERAEASGWHFQSVRWWDDRLVVFAGKTRASIIERELEQSGPGGTRP
ncbi:MAG: hypothetical protein ABIV28_05955 [Longimicrobiales bacterium]